MQKRSFIWSLTGIGAVIGFMLTVQISSRPQSSTSMSSYLDLRTQIQEQIQENQILTSEISKQNAQLVQYQASEGKTNEMQKVLEQDAKTVAAEAGMTPVSGPGLTITIEYDPTLPVDPALQGQNQSTATLFDAIADQELSFIVNDLFANGAKAISINGQRLVTTSSIRNIQRSDTTFSLQVNTVPVTMPYVFHAVGDVDKMLAVLSLNEVESELRQMQVRCTITPNRNPDGVTVPAYDGVLPGVYAKEVKSE